MAYKKIINNLYLGDRHSCPKFCNYIVSAAEEIFNDEKPQNLKNNFFFTNNNSRLVINLLDYAPKSEVDEENLMQGLKFIDQHLKNNCVYIHCLYGVNRSASLVFIYLVIKNKLDNKNFNLAFGEFQKIYPLISPNPGYWHYLKQNFPYINLKAGLNDNWND